MLLRPLYSGYSLMSHHHKEIPIQYRKICSYVHYDTHIHVQVLRSLYLCLYKKPDSTTFTLAKKYLFILLDQIRLFCISTFQIMEVLSPFELPVNLSLQACNHQSRNRNIQEFLSPFRKTEQKTGCNYYWQTKKLTLPPQGTKLCRHLKAVSSAN